MTDTIENILDYISTAANKLDGVPSGVLVILACIVAGYILKTIKKFPNDAIPWFVTILGGILNIFLADINSDLPVRTWIVRFFAIGLVKGFAAFIIHNRLLKPLEEKWGLFQGNPDPNVPTPPTTPTP